MPLDPATAWSALLTALREQPAAELNAVDEQGLFAPLPPAMRALGHAEQVARSGIELVDPADHGLLIDVWVQALEQGSGDAVVRDVDAPDRRTRLQFFDLRAEHGVLAAVASPYGERGEEPAGRTATDDVPRLGRTRKDSRSVFVGLDADAERMLGDPPGGLLGTSSRELVHPDDQGLAVSSWLEVLRSPGGSQRARLRMRRGDGDWLWVDVLNHNRLDDPAQACVVSDLVDVSEEMALREDVRARERLLQRLAHVLPVGLVQVDAAGEVVYSNERLHEVLGLAPQAALTEQLETVVPQDRRRVLAAFTTALRTQRDADLQIEVDAGGERRTCSVALRPVTDDDGAVEGVLGCLTDITESVRLRAELEQRATYDALTGCLNRAALLRGLARQLQDVAPGSGCAVLFFDLDGFKAVNDTQGHAAGDAVLRQVAAGLHGAARPRDAVGRLGGDEFVVACPGVPSAAEALLLAEHLRAHLVTPGLSGVSASTGIAWSDEAGTDADTLLARADAAMYRAKRTARGEVALWQGLATA